MYAPRLTFRSPVLTVPYFNLDGLMENPKKRIFDQLLSGEKDDQALQKKKSCRGTSTRSPLAQQVEPSDPVFAFELTFVRLDRGALHAHEKPFWSRHRRLVQVEKKAKRDKEDLYRVLLVLQRRLPDDLCGKVLQLAL